MKFRIGTTPLLLLLILALPLAGCNSDTGDEYDAAESSTDTASMEGDFKSPLGVQLWSFRSKAQNDPMGTFEMTADMGFTHVETAGLYGMPAEEFATAIEDAGLKVTSMHASYDEFKNDIETVIANAKAVGAQYAGIAWYPHEQGNFTLETAEQAIADFNSFGKSLNDAGLTFFYHNHGYEPSPNPNGEGTLLDLIIDETDPELVAFEMDVLWTWLPDVDPVELIQRHPGRFKLMHIKDMKQGLERGSLSGGLPAEQKSVIGEGQVDWPVLLKAAEDDGFEHFYLEDESTDPIGNAPKSYAYLKSLTYSDASGE
ncbi:MAG: sugar phosphate isomerase/epimerase [Rhodothermaceae bacterium]|nr:sugar phosphate isomerase/epimerase [Rhodothermaceae bacterium]